MAVKIWFEPLESSSSNYITNNVLKLSLAAILLNLAKRVGKKFPANVIPVSWPSLFRFGV